MGTSGFLNIYKEPDCTSHDVVAAVRKVLKKADPAAPKPKVGHTGTLDPAAEGVLPICLGRATKLADYAGDTKGYRAVLKLGLESDTQDDTGKILEQRPVVCGPDEIREAIRSFRGEISQLPPMYSAVKVGGKKLYELAREGKSIERKPRNVTIYDISIVEFLDDTSLVLDIKCSRGTYIRSLCADIGAQLGCGGLMGRLVRTASGPFLQETSARLESLQSLDPESLYGHIVPMEAALPLPQIGVAQEATKLLHNGNKIPICLFQGLPQDAGAGMRFWVRDNTGRLAGLYELLGDDKMKPIVML